MKRRFKIDISGSSCFYFGIFIEEKGWFRTCWRRIETFETRDKAMDFYEKIKDLPEYL